MSEAQEGGGSGEEQRITASQNIPAARALEVVSRLIEDDAGRRDYKSDPSGAFRRGQERLDEQPLRDASYGDIPPASRKALEALSVEELEALSNLNRTFIQDGLYVDVPSPGKLFYH